MGLEQEHVVGDPNGSIFQGNLPLKEKLEKARTELLDLSARNRLLNMPRGAKRSRVIEVIDEKSAEVFRLLVREAKPFTFLPGRSAGQIADSGNFQEIELSEPDEIEQLAQPDDESVDERGVLRRHSDTRLQTRLTSKGLQKRLLELYLDSRTLEEEQGVNILFLTLGALKWTDPNNDESARFAPLLLIPVQLERSSAGERFHLKVRQEDFTANLSLQSYLERVHGVAMPDFEATETFDPLDYMEQIEQCVGDKKGWGVFPDEMSVGFFSFAKFLMYRDLDPSVWPQGATIGDHPLIRGLLSEGFGAETDMVHEDANVDELVPPADLVHIVDCDSSQALAIYEVRRGKNLVIQGPPGTGKSQTIANIIAAAVRDNKTVLFVSEKMAALDVVKRRLDKTGVGDVCLELHSNKANKRAVLEEIRRTWELGAPRVGDHARLFARLTEVRNELNAHTRRLHEIDERSGLSPYQIQGHLTRLEASGEKPNDIQLVDPEKWGRHGYEERHSLLSDLVARVGAIGKPDDHAWVGVGLESISPMDAQRFTTRVEALLTHLANMRVELEKAAKLLEREEPFRLADVTEMVALLRRLAAAPALSESALTSEAWEKLGDIEELLAQGARYRRAITDLAGRVNDDAWKVEFEDHRQALTELPGAYGSEHFHRLLQVAELVLHMKAEAKALACALGRDAGSTLSDFKTLCRIGARVAAAPPASPETFASDLWDSGIERAGELAGAVLSLESARSSIGNQLTEAAWTTDLSSARAVLASRGKSPFRFLSGQWRRANRLVRSVAAQPDQSLPATLELLDALSRGKVAKQVIEAEDSFGRSAFGRDWRGERTSSAALLALVEWMRSLKGLGAEPRLIASRSPEKKEVETRSLHLSQLCTKATPLFASVWEDLSEARSKLFEGVSGLDRVDLDIVERVAGGHAQAWNLISGVMVTAPQNVETAQALLAELEDGRAALKAIQDNHALGYLAFDQAWKDEDSDWTKLTQACEWVKANSDVRELAGRVGERSELAAMAKLLEVSQMHALASFNALASELKLDVPASIGDIPENAPRSTIEWRLRRWIDERQQIFEWVNYRDRAARAVAMGCGELVARLNNGRLVPTQVVSAFEMAYFEAAYDWLVREKPELARFDGATHAGLVRDFVTLDQERIHAAREEALQAHHSLIPRSDGALGPLGILRGEIQRRRGNMPIRKLVERAAPALQAIKPVFMMSPLSVAQFLPPGSMKFDLLVMDEASQIQPVDALGAIARANQVVVVGDPKQLPPTSFFSKMTAQDGDDDEGDGAAVADVESILGLFMARGMPKRMLRWHYRSRHQSLIAVSNHQFYEDKLFIVPSPYTARGGMGLRFHHVADGLFEAGGRRINVVEAKVVAQAIVRHAQEFPKLSLGVAAFSAAQRRAIIDELELLRRNISPEAESFFSDHPTEPFFVKNLENVQGDERDVIFISVGYGRSTPGGRVAMRFGPLGADGGERRLNVLISRAKQRCDVFASMTDEDIDPSFAAGKLGVESFRLFLQYARTGRLPIAEVTGRDYDSIFEEQVAHALRTYGYEVQLQVGIAGFFIDLAIVDPARPGRFLLGIECDGATYHSSKSARDRDRLRQMILEEHGWAIHRIWSTDWFQRPEEQLGLVMERIESLRGVRSGEERMDEHIQAITTFPESSSVERDPITEESVESSFPAYREAEPRRPANCRTELLGTPVSVLMRMVVEVVTIEGPVHVDRVIVRIREAWDLKRSGQRIEKVVGFAIDVALSSKLITRNQNFLSLPGTAATPRDRTRVEAADLRKAEMLPPAEIRAAAIQLLSKNYGAPRTQLIQAVAHGLGIRNTGAQVRAAIEQVVDEALKEGAFVETNGLIQVRGREEQSSPSGVALG